MSKGYKRTGRPAGRPRIPAEQKLQSFSAIYWQIAQQAAEGRLPDPVVLDNSNAAANVRHRFHIFRRLLTEAKHPHAYPANELMLHIEQSTITFSDPFHMLGPVPPVLAPEEQGRAPDVAPNVSESAAPPAPATPLADHGEKVVEDWLKGKPKQETACEHEWGLYNCSKCGLPRPDTEMK